MIDKKEDKTSDLYRSPEDRISPDYEGKEFLDAGKEEDSSEGKLVDSLNLEEGVKDKAFLIQKKKRRNVILFLIFALVDLALLGYIIYLVVSIFLNL